jgi:ArsR family transcriptional regulator
VELLHGDLDSPQIRKAVGQGADAVFASRLLHHAPKPAAFLAELSELLRPGGALVVIDYVRHDDESMREREADVWLGFDAAELKRFARTASLEDARVSAIPGAFTGRGPDHHLTWQVLVAKKRDGSSTKRKNGASHG